MHVCSGQTHRCTLKERIESHTSTYLHPVGLITRFNLGTGFGKKIKTENKRESQVYISHDIGFY